MRDDAEIFAELLAICPPKQPVMRRERVCREVNLSAPVSLWLASLGCVVYAEVDAGLSGPIDHVGLREDGSVVTVQMKLGLTKKVIYQAMLCQLATLETYAAVQCKPRQSSLDRAEKIGVGVWFDGAVILSPHARHSDQTYSYRHRVIEACRRLQPGGTGGLPNLKGDGPAQRCAAKVRDYLAANPHASWKEIWRDVPNHYAHHRSMSGALLSRGLIT